MELVGVRGYVCTASPPLSTPTVGLGHRGEGQRAAGRRRDHARAVHEQPRPERPNPSSAGDAVDAEQNVQGRTDEGREPGQADPGERALGLAFAGERVHRHAQRGHERQDGQPDAQEFDDQLTRHVVSLDRIRSLRSTGARSRYSQRGACTKCSRGRCVVQRSRIARVSASPLPSFSKR